MMNALAFNDYEILYKKNL